MLLTYFAIDLTTTACGDSKKSFLCCLECSSFSSHTFGKAWRVLPPSKQKKRVARLKNDSWGVRCGRDNHLVIPPRVNSWRSYTEHSKKCVCIGVVRWEENIKTPFYHDPVYIKKILFGFGWNPPHVHITPHSLTQPLTYPTAHPPHVTQMPPPHSCTLNNYLTPLTHLTSTLHFLIFTVVPDHVRPSISGPIRSIKCTVGLNVLCKRDWCVVEMYPVWPKWSRDLAPSTLSTYPPPHLPGVVGTQFTGSIQEGWTWTVKWRVADSPASTPCSWIMYVILLLSHFRKLYIKCCQMIGCLVLITVVY